MVQQVKLTATVNETQSGQRLDFALAELFVDYSRSRLKTWIVDGCVSVDGTVIDKPKVRLLGGEIILVTAEIDEDLRWQAEKIELNIVYEDESLLIINKPRGLVVHPGAGQASGTLLNGLLHYAPALAGVPRAGIVHRLDKDTTGLMVVAKTLTAHAFLVDTLRRREIVREYEAMVVGELVAGGTVNQPIARHKTKRTHMAINPTGKPAVTHYRVINRFNGFTHLRLRLETGRTHQIRVHMAHINHPLIGDPLYGGRPRFSKNSTALLIHTLQHFNRQALHAALLRLPHPVQGDLMTWQSPLPADMQQLLTVLAASSPVS